MDKPICPECRGATVYFGAGVAGYNSLGYPYPVEMGHYCAECSGTGIARCWGCRDMEGVSAPAELNTEEGALCRSCFTFILAEV